MSQAEKLYSSIKIDRPVFIVAPHRSGTTLLYNILAKHPQTGYFNQANRRLRNTPRLAHLVSLVRGDDKPAEAQKLWDLYWKNGDDIMGSTDAPPEVIKWYRQQVRAVLRLRKAGRFIAKYPRLSLRMEWINTVFPDAVFIHMKRDWRAVVSSTVVRKVNRQNKAGDWFGVRVPGWKDMGGLPHEMAAGRIFRVVTQQIIADGTGFKDRFFSTSYERLCSDPPGTIREITDRCGLDWTPEFENTIPTDLRSSNYKWREHLDEKVIARIRAEDESFYARYEYGDPDNP